MYACTGQATGARSAAHAKGNYVRLRQITYLAAALLVGAGLVLVGGSPAQAAAPDNDTFAGAVAIGSLPFTATVDTTQATTDSVDAEACSSGDVERPSGRRRGLELIVREGRLRSCLRP